MPARSSGVPSAHLEVIVNIALDASTLSLARDGLIAVRDARGTRIRCLSGHLWITEDRSELDTVIGPNQSFTIGHGGLTLIMAVSPATLQLAERRSGVAGRVRSWVTGWLLPRTPRRAVEC